MGLAKNAAVLKKVHSSDKIIALVGNPNVGKSTLFNELTGLRQHTGNWPGKTVTLAYGYSQHSRHRQKKYNQRRQDSQHGQNGCILVDLPGCYSLMARSAEEEVAGDFICFGGADTVIVVCDATCLERSMILVLQALEMTGNVVVCVNLMDEAEKNNLCLDLPALSAKLGVPVVGTAARKKRGLSGLMNAAMAVASAENSLHNPIKIDYPEAVTSALTVLAQHLYQLGCAKCITELSLDVCHRLAVMLLQLDPDDESSASILAQALSYLDPATDPALLHQALRDVRTELNHQGISGSQIKDSLIASIAEKAGTLCRDTVVMIGHKASEDKTQRDKNLGFSLRDSHIDKVLTGKWTAFPIMILALLGVFWLTITGANYPSQLISHALFWVEDQLLFFFQWLRVPQLFSDMLILGVYRVLAWVVSVMLPPMAIFFPLFTLLEDVGFLPRIAFNLDKWFKKCCACGKQALTMCVGFGCNAAGVIGCRIIDSPRERLIAILTNSFVPCNGKFPTLIVIISMFFVGTGFLGDSLLSAALLTGIIILGISMTFVASKFLSQTLLKGTSSSFSLELPPYRRPQIGKIIVRSVFDRTFFVLKRAVCAAAPAGLMIWLLANISVENTTLLMFCSDFLDPFAHLLGLDGVILLAFILGFPANEIVIPIMIMIYMAQGSILELDDLAVFRKLLTDNGWTWVTAMSFMLFSLMHWPCSTTCLTIKKETRNWKWTLIAFALPTVAGIVICMVFAAAARGLSGL